MPQTAHKSIVFVPYTNDKHLNGYYYRATLSEDSNSAHYILLYGVGAYTQKEPKFRWIMLDITEHHLSEDRGESETVVNAMETWDSMHSIVAYVGDMYNAETRFHDAPRDGAFIP
jgi:hypothetical protein